MMYEADHGLDCDETQVQDHRDNVCLFQGRVDLGLVMVMVVMPMPVLMCVLMLVYVFVYALVGVSSFHGEG